MERRLGAARHQVGDELRFQIMYGNLETPSEEVLGHGLTHIAEADEAYSFVHPIKPFMKYPTPCSILENGKFRS